MRHGRIVLIIFATGITLFGCRNEPAVNRAAAQQELTVGHFASMTGAQGTFGQSMDEGIRMAFDEVNKHGGVRGRPIRVVTEDDQSKSDEAATAVQKLLTRDHVIAVLGEASSSPTLAAAPICQRAQVPMISPSATNPAVTLVGDYIFRTCFIDPYQGEAMANYLIDRLHIRRAAVMVDAKADYSRGLSEFFERTFMRRGGQIVSHMSYQGGDADFRPPLTAIKAAHPEVVFVPGYYTDVAQITAQGRDLGIAVPFAGGDGWDSPKLVEIGGRAMEGCFFSDHYFVDDQAPAVRTFVNNYAKRYHKKPDALAALGYDAAGLLAKALTLTEEPISSRAVRNALARIKDYPGVTGRLNFDSNRNPTGKRLVMLEVKNGQFQIKDTYEPKL